MRNGINGFIRECCGNFLNVYIDRLDLLCNGNCFVRHSNLAVQKAEESCSPEFDELDCSASVRCFLIGFPALNSENVASF